MLCNSAGDPFDPQILFTRVDELLRYEKLYRDSGQKFFPAVVKGSPACEHWIARLERQKNSPAKSSHSEEKLGGQATPIDRTSLAPANKLRIRHGLSQRKFDKILREHPEIYREKPSPQRKLIHVGHFEQVMDKRSEAAFKAVDEKPEIVHEFLQEVEDRKSQTRRKKLAK